MSEYEGQDFGPRSKIIIQDDVGLSNDERDEIRTMIMESGESHGVNIVDSPSLTRPSEGLQVIEGEDMLDMVVRRLKETDDPNFDNDLLVEIFMKAEVLT